MPKGLTTTQAQRLLAEHGSNVLDEHKKESFLSQFIRQFNNYLTILLIVAALLSFLVGESIDGSLIMGIVILNALFGLYQESKAQEALAALKDMTVTRVRVIRDGVEIEVDSRDLVPGDAIFLEEGMKVPADAHVTESRALEINEAALTGESMPVAKKATEELFMGTIVARGRGYAVVAQTGMHTKCGKIAAELTNVQETKTPLQQKLEDLTRTIGIVGIGTSIIVFALSFIQGSGYFPSFLLAISLAVAIVPEGLPAVMTITLAIGVKEMARNRAIIRKLSAIEALGSITLIATDKTGTLTTNKMQVKHIYINGKEHDTDTLPAKDPTLELLLRNSILCSTANLVYVHDHGHYEVLGDPTEGAALLLAQKRGINHEDIRNQWNMIDEVPFDSVTRRMMVTVRKGKETLRFTKGAPESVMPLCSHIYNNKKTVALTGVQIKKINQRLSQWTRQGLRVIAYSYNKGTQKDIFIGMAALHDPPRQEVREALVKTHAAGIRVVMITGDNEKTAETIGVSIGLLNHGDEIITGAQLDEHTDKQLLPLLAKIRIFARTSPFQKHRIVKLYQELGEIVAVTGDGVNDAIALKQADVGIAMGLVGTDVARETADMVLVDDNFATIVLALEEGRNIIKNLKNSIKYLLSCNIAEALVLLTGLLIGIPHILYPIQLLYINLVTDGLPALSLAFAPKHGRIMHEKPQEEMSLFAAREKSYVFGVGVVTALLVLAALFIFADGVDTGKTAAFCVLVLIQSFVLIDLWLNHRFVATHLRHLMAMPFLIAFIFPFITQFIIVSTPSIATLFAISTVPMPQYAVFIAIAAGVLIGIELLKKVLSVRQG